MDLSFTEEQDALRAMVRQLANKGGLEATRAMEVDPRGYDPVVWKQLADSGITGLALPTEMGGEGGSLLDTVVVYEELGRGLVASPLFESVAVSAEAIRLAGDDDQRSKWLPRIASGDAIVSPAWLEADGGFAEAGVSLEAVPADGGWTLTGEKWHVAYAPSADALLVIGRAEAGWTLFLVDPADPGVTMEDRTTLAREQQSRVRFDHVAGELVGTPGGARDVWQQVMNRAVIFAAARATGAARRVLEIAVEHAKTRHQFDKPLGAFQAVAHYLADGLTGIDAAETLVWQAAWAGDNGHSIARLGPMSKLAACDVFRDVSAVALQICGGLGFTIEFDAQLFFRRAKQWQLSWWDTDHLEELIAADALDAVS